MGLVEGWRQQVKYQGQQPLGQRKRRQKVAQRRVAWFESGCEGGVGQPQELWGRGGREGGERERQRED